MIGFNSQYPTLFVSDSPLSANFDKTGRIGIGNITDPQAKLHLLADEGEEAAIFLQPHNWDNGESAKIYLGSLSTFIIADKQNGIGFQSEGDYSFGNNKDVLISSQSSTKLKVKDGDIYLQDIDHGIIMKSPDGKCWRGQLDNSGQLMFSAMGSCPEDNMSSSENTGTAAESFKAYPNPGSDYLNIELESNEDFQALMYDDNGRKALELKIKGPKAKIFVGGLPKGAYVLKAISASGTYSTKIILN